MINVWGQEYWVDDPPTVSRIEVEVEQPVTAKDGMTKKLQTLRLHLELMRKKHYEEGAVAHNLLIDSTLEMIEDWI
jgi:hypothetical protein